MMAKINYWTSSTHPLEEPETEPTYSLNREGHLLDKEGLPQRRLPSVRVATFASEEECRLFEEYLRDLWQCAGGE